ncbi:hypothetical protein N0V83_003404 [Neocucurbitaria cava]|uniref:Uncharacterized protein n=1 Tax=Neocucurbitaria cava TaxID=798079 RepID=A0A9W8YB29_9PLEO|nr:hypothetical protein N0V83_003404 [Neocucurbitaria cava]
MFSAFSALKGMWSAPRSRSTAAVAASTPDTPPTSAKQTAQAVPSPMMATPTPMGSVNYPTLPCFDNPPIAAPTPVEFMSPLQQRPTSVPFGGASQSKASHVIDEDHHTHEGRHATSTPTPDKGGDRLKLQPKRQQDCHRKPSPPKKQRDFVSEIVYEVASKDNPLPEGYLGTFRGSRWYAPDYNACLDCGLAGEHRLVCGHWVKSEEPCGINCKSENFDQDPFNCPICHDVVHDILRNKLTDAEQAKLTHLKSKNAALLLGVAIEIVMKRAPELKANVTETIHSILRKNYGRSCGFSTGPPPVETPPLEQTIREIQEHQEQKEHDRYAKENPLNKHEKRKDMNDTTDADTDSGSQSDSDSTLVGSTHTPKSSNKKLKKKLETHREPVTERTRGKKRTLPVISSAYGHPAHRARRITLTAPKDIGEALFVDATIIEMEKEEWSRKKRRVS